MWIRPCETYFERLGQVKTKQNYEGEFRGLEEHVRCFKERLLFDKDEWLIWLLQGKPLAVNIKQKELKKCQRQGACGKSD